MKAIKILIIILASIIIYSCSQDNPISINEVRYSPILINKFNGIITLVEVNKLSPNKMILFGGGIGLYSTNGGLNFDTLSPLYYINKVTLKFDNKSDDIIYCGADDAQVYIYKNFIQYKTILYGDLGRINIIYPTMNDTLVLAGKTVFHPQSVSMLFWINRKNFNWYFIESYLDTLLIGFSRNPRRILDISDAIKENKHVVAISDFAMFGIILTEDNFKSYKIFHTSDKFFIKHALNQDGSFGFALIATPLGDTLFYKSQDLFRTLTPMAVPELQSANIKDFFFIDKNYLLLYGKKSQNKSVILLSRDNFTNFETLLETEGEITSVDYVPINKYLYFVNTSNNLSELYKISLK